MAMHAVFAGGYVALLPLIDLLVIKKMRFFVRGFWLRLSGPFHFETLRRLREQAPVVVA
ncbi:hypothetical protein [Desulfovibrio sp. 86]|jgi:hypothetical protein|uniref:hypothetical protein n=1 Tax=Desulfovibrio sp. 86 TaxID=2666132 RepID=UPI0015D361E1|nr:hypothetical protein [Desulfovibrio sp. 86]